MVAMMWYSLGNQKWRINHHMILHQNNVIFWCPNHICTNKCHNMRFDASTGEKFCRLLLLPLNNNQLGQQLTCRHIFSWTIVDQTSVKFESKRKYKLFLRKKCVNLVMIILTDFHPIFACLYKMWFVDRPECLRAMHTPKRGSHVSRILDFARNTMSSILNGLTVSNVYPAPQKRWRARYLTVECVAVAKTT